MRGNASSRRMRLRIIFIILRLAQRWSIFFNTAFFDAAVNSAAVNPYLSMLEQFIKDFMNLLSVKACHLFQGFGIDPFLGMLDYLHYTKSSRHVCTDFLAWQLRSKSLLEGVLNPNRLLRNCC